LGAQPPAPIWAPCNSMSPPDWIYKVLFYASITPNYWDWNGYGVCSNLASSGEPPHLLHKTILTTGSSRFAVSAVDVFLPRMCAIQMYIYLLIYIVEMFLRALQLRWAMGLAIVSVPDHRIPKLTYYSEVLQGSRLTGRSALQTTWKPTWDLLVSILSCGEPLLLLGPSGGRHMLMEYKLLNINESQLTVKGRHSFSFR